MKRVMTIAGSDSCGGAGLQADLKTFAAMGVYGVSAVTAVTAQNSVAVTGVYALPEGFVSRQISTVLEDIPVDAIKTGMLANTAIIRAVSESLMQYPVPHVVVDPVMVATTGDLLLNEHMAGVMRAFRDILLPLATVVTPNIPEAEILTGRTIRGIDDMKTAAVDIHGFGAGNVVLKGGHTGTEDAVDILFDGNSFVEYRGARISTANTHGTGCTFAAALAAGLALGFHIREAVAEAKEFVRMSLEHGFAPGRGRGMTNQFGKLYRDARKETK